MIKTLMSNGTHTILSLRFSTSLSGFTQGPFNISTVKLDGSSTTAQCILTDDCIHKVLLISMVSTNTNQCLKDRTSFQTLNGVVGFQYDIALPCKEDITFTVSNFTDIVSLSVDSGIYKDAGKTVIDKFEIYPPNGYNLNPAINHIYSFVTAHNVNSYFQVAPLNYDFYYLSACMMLVQTSPAIYLQKMPYTTSSIQGDASLLLNTIDIDVYSSHPTTYNITTDLTGWIQVIQNGSYLLDSSLGNIGNETIVSRLELESNFVIYPKIYIGLDPIDVAYPFGIVSGPLIDKFFKFSSLFTTNPFNTNNFARVYDAGFPITYRLNYDSPTPSKNYLVQILKFTVIMRTASTATYQIEFQCQTGLLDIKIGGYMIGGVDLIAGDIFNGIVEKEIPLLTKVRVFDMKVSSRSSGMANFNNGDIINLNMDKLDIQYTAKGHLSPSNFTKIYFANNQVDTTNKVTENTLYFSLITNDPLYKPILRFSFTQTFKKEAVFRGSWNAVSGLYEIPFTIPMNMIQGSLSYSIISMSSLESDHFLSSFGWIITIQDEVSGVLSARFNVTSDLDKLPRQYSLLLPTTGSTTFNISIPIDNALACVNQTFTITDIALIDNAGNEALSLMDFDPLVKVRYTPEYDQNINISVICSIVNKAIDIMPPNIVNFNYVPRVVDVGQIGGAPITFYIEVYDSVGISDRHDPVVFLQTLSNYSCPALLPYGFGLGIDPILISVYGLTDKALNVAGYNSIDLDYQKYMGPSILNTTFNKTPILLRASDITTQGGFLTLIGNQFGTNPVQLYVSAQYGADVIKQEIIGMSGTTMILYIHPVDSDFTITVSKGNMWKGTNSTLANGNKLFKYTTIISIGMVHTYVTVFIEWFALSSPVTFAGDTWIVGASSIKYSIELSKYQFVSQLNTLQLVLRSTMATQSNEACSIATKGTNSQSAVDWMTLKINQYTLYGRYMKKAVIDNRVVAITNTIDTTTNDTYSLTPTLDSFISINIPYYIESVNLDPDFSILVETDPDYSGVCSNSSTKWMTTPRLAGIIIGSLTLAAAATTVAIVVKLKQRKNLLENQKLERKLNKLPPVQ
eukprot:gene7638-8935_t